jgi:anti-sigma-K factor RskA
MWAIDGDTPRSIGLLDVDDDGRARAVVPFDADRSDVFAITVEPAGGSEQPTSAPVMTAEL